MSNHDVRHELFQITHVARVCAGQQVFAHELVQIRRLRAWLALARVFLHKVMGEGNDVLGSLTERRQSAGPTGNAIVQVAPKMMVGLFEQQVAVCGTDQPEFGVPPGVAANALVGFLLDHAQELCLKRRRQLAHLVEEKRAAIGQSECPIAGSDCAGKCAALVSEKFAAGKFRYDRRAVQDDEVAFVRTRIQSVDQSCHQFFAGARFTADQNGNVSIKVRHFDDLAQHGNPGRTLADQSAAHSLRLEDSIDGLPAPELGLDRLNRISCFVPDEHIGSAGLQ